MKKIVVVFAMALMSAFSFAQQTANKNKNALADAAWTRAGCGSDAIHFDVEMNKNQHTLAEPESGKALVYVFEDDLSGGGFPTTRVGLDGKWTGGNVSESYMFFPVSPGGHRLCSNWQGHPKMGAALDFTAEAGKAYFFREKIASSDDVFTLRQVPEAEGHFLIASHGVSTSARKPGNDGN